MMTAAANNVLSAADLKVLRKSDSVCFQHVRGESCIRAIKRRDRDKGGDVETRISTRSHFHQYGNQPGDKMKDPESEAACFAMSNNYAGSELRTLLLMMKPGDLLYLVWMRDAGNQYTEESTCRNGRLHIDDLRLELRRKVRNDEIRLAFHVYTSMCPNNSARMIQER